MISLLVSCGGESLTVEQLERRSAQFLQAGDFEKAQLDINNALKLEPDNSHLRLKQGDVYFASGQFAAAEVAYRKAYQDPMAQSGILLKIGDALLAQGQHQRVIDEIADTCYEFDGDYRPLCLLQKATAELRTPNTDQQITLQSFVEVLRELDGHELEAAQVALAKLDPEPVVQQARAHFECQTQSRNEEHASFAERFGVLPNASGNVIRVGPERDIKSIAEAANKARDGDTIEIDGGYTAETLRYGGWMTLRFVA